MLRRPESSSNSRKDLVAATHAQCLAETCAVKGQDEVYYSRSTKQAPTAV